MARMIINNQLDKYMEHINVTMSHWYHGTTRLDLVVEVSDEDDITDIFKDICEKYDKYHIYEDYKFTIEYRIDNILLVRTYIYDRYDNSVEYTTEQYNLK